MILLIPQLKKGNLIFVKNLKSGHFYPSWVTFVS